MTYVRQKVSKFKEKYRNFNSGRICVVACCFTHGRQEEKGGRRGQKGQNEEEGNDGGGCIKVLENYRFILVSTSAASELTKKQLVELNH